MNLSRTLRLAVVSSALSLTTWAALPPEEWAALRTQAESGDPIAQHNLGLKFADPKDAHFDLVQAYAWLKTASANGTGGNALAIVKGQLSAAQIAQAEARAAELVKLTAASGGPGPAYAGDTPMPAALEGAQATAEFKKYSEELAAAWKENEQLKLEVGKLRAAAANFEGERNGLLQRIAGAEAGGAAVKELDGLKQQLAAAATQLAQEKQAAEEREKALMGELNRAKEAFAQREAELQASIVAAKSTVPQASDVLKASQAQLEESQMKMEAALRSLELQQKETERVQKALLAVDAEAASLADQLASAKAQLASMASTAAPTASAPAASAELATLQARLARAEESLQQAEAESARLRGQLAEVSAPPPAPAVEGEVSPALADAQSKLTIALRSYQLQREEMDRLQQRLTALENEKAGVEANLSQAQSRVSEAEGKAASAEQMQAEIATLREQLRHTQNQLVAEINERTRQRDLASVAPRATGGPLLFAPQRPSPVPVAPTPTPEPAVREYTVRPGDTLSKIARRMLGDADRWPEIIDANRDVVTNPSALPVGVKLRIP